MAKKGRILSGHRPTGQLHLGHLEGTLRTWASLQDDYECFFEIADWHALTTDFEETEALRENIEQVAIDWLAAGLDPERSVLFVQSDVKEHAELHLLLSMVTPVSWLERCPTYKEQRDQIGEEKTAGYGFLGYPVLQAADIIVYKADIVPIGKDQLPHLELTREIVRRFNNFYGEVFPEPEAKLSQFSVVPGTDGRKMSKSYGNTIDLADEPDEIEQKIRKMFTDPTKIYQGDAGHPDKCPVFVFQGMYNREHTASIKQACEAGDLGCVDCKAAVTEKLLEALAPVMARRRELEADRDLVRDVLARGAQQARQVAAATMEDVRAAMKL
ncbi:MAG: tryptophan--tRNA ligase [Armatimonadetes bacterium]|nr:tryptophan--tRNA ligase [Armatimonadota bacterium]